MNFVLDTHTHTLASGHAYSTIREMAYTAGEKGLKLLGITEHAPKMPGSCHEFYFRNLRAADRLMYGVELLFGAELNILTALWIFRILFCRNWTLPLPAFTFPVWYREQCWKIRKHISMP